MKRSTSPAFWLFVYVYSSKGPLCATTEMPKQTDLYLVIQNKPEKSRGKNHRFLKYLG